MYYESKLVHVFWVVLFTGIPSSFVSTIVFSRGEHRLPVSARGAPVACPAAVCWRRPLLRAARNCCQCQHSPRLRTMQAQPATADQAQPATADHATIYLFHWPLGPSRWTTNRFFWFVNQLVSCLLILNASFVTSSRRYAGDSVGSAGGGHALDEAASERSR